MTDQQSLTDAQQAAQKRFFPQQSIEDHRRLDLDELRLAAVDLATQIELRVPPGRNKSLALTALEDTLMRATRGVAAPDDAK